MFKLSGFFGSLALCAQIAVAILPNGNTMRAPIAPIITQTPSAGPVVSRNGTQLPAYSEWLRLYIISVDKDFHNCRHHVLLQPAGMSSQTQ